MNYLFPNFVDNLKLAFKTIRINIVQILSRILHSFIVFLLLEYETKKLEGFIFLWMMPKEWRLLTESIISCVINLLEVLDGFP